VQLLFCLLGTKDRRGSYPTLRAGPARFDCGALTPPDRGSAMQVDLCARALARRCLACACAAGLLLSGAHPVPAYDDSTFREIETKYIFGFTEGSSIGLQGEKEFSSESVAALGKRDGRFFATQTKLEFEHTPSQFVQIEFGALANSHDIENVTGLDDRHAVSFGGLFGELRYLLLDRGALSPIAVPLSAEPVWRRIAATR